MTYLVIESHLSYCIALDEIGRFVKIANFCYEVGTYVENVIELKSPQKALKKLNIATFGSLAACFLMFFSFHCYNYMLPFGTIYLSVNPYVQLEISRRDTVVGLTGLNDDGNLLLDRYKYKGKYIIDVTDDLMDRAIELGFLSDGDTIVISIDAPNNEWFIENGILLRHQMEEHLADKVRMEIIIQVYDSENPIKYISPENLEQLNLPVEVENTPTITQPQPSNPQPQISNSINLTSGYGNDSEYEENGFGNSIYSSDYQTLEPVSNTITNPQDSNYSNNSNDSDYNNYSEYDNNSGYDNNSEYDD